MIASMPSHSRSAKGSILTGPVPGNVGIRFGTLLQRWQRLRSRAVGTFGPKSMKTAKYATRQTEVEVLHPENRPAGILHDTATNGPVNSSHKRKMLG